MKLLKIVTLTGLLLLPSFAVGLKSWSQLAHQNSLLSSDMAMVDLKLLIPKVAAIEGVTPEQLAVIVLLESGGSPKPCVTGAAGEQGITQVLPSTRAAIGKHLDTYKPVEALMVAAKYLKIQQRRASSELEAFAAYNGGPRVYSKGMRDSTKKYVKKADDYLKKAKINGWQSLFHDTVLQNTDKHICQQRLAAK